MKRTDIIINQGHMQLHMQHPTGTSASAGISCPK